jgi:HTH-type transcriptional regulator, quorum sensing regulator NprR
MCTIGQKIRELRVKRGLTQIELANGIVTPSMISLIETDKANPSPKLLQRIAEKLGVAMDYFLDEGASPWETLSAYTLAKAMLLAGKYEEAYDLLQQLTGSTTSLSLSDIQLLLGECLFHMERYDEAIKVFEQILDGQTSPYERVVQFQCFYRIGQSYIKQQNYTLAQHYWSKAFEWASRSENIDPSAIRTLLLDYARLCLLTEQREEAARLLKEANHIQNDGTTIQEIALSYVRKAKEEQKMENFKIATDYSHRAVGLFETIQLLKQSIDIQVYSAILRGEQGDVAEALDALLNCKQAYLALGIESENSYIHREAARLYLQMRDYDNALFHATKSLHFARHEKERAYALRVLAMIKKELDRLPEAISDIKKAIRLFKSHKMYDELTKSYALLSGMFATISERQESGKPL